MLINIKVINAIILILWSEYDNRLIGNDFKLKNHGTHF